MTLDKFYSNTLGHYTKEQKESAVLDTYQDCFKSFAYLCTEEGMNTFGTDEFNSPIPKLNNMSKTLKENPNMGTRIDSMTAIRSFAACRMWEEYKTTYQVDPTFYNIFKNTEKLKVYPTELPHVPVPFFAVDLTRVDCMASGMYVFIANTIGGVTILINVLYENNVYQTLTAIRYDECTLENGILSYDWKKSKLFDKDAVNDADKTLKENTQKIIDEQYHGDSKAFLKALSKIDPEQADVVEYILDDYKIDYQKELEDLKVFIFQFLTYLSCKNPDIRESRDSKKASERALRLGKKEAPERVFEVGKRFGQRYTLMLKENEKRVEGVGYGGTHASPVPHLVSAHWHGYWCGKDHSVYEVLWVACYFKGGVKSAADCDEIIHECEENHAIPYSHGEKMLYQTLNVMQLEHTPQYRVETGRIFDDCVTLHGRQVFIEIDGEQHFRPVKNWDFEKTMESDKEKNEYCREHNIPLLRIRYDELTHIADILTDLRASTLKGFPEDCWLSKMSKDEYYSISSEKEIA